jgi:hypothetical protein
MHDAVLNYIFIVLQLLAGIPGKSKLFVASGLARRDSLAILYVCAPQNTRAPGNEEEAIWDTVRASVFGRRPLLTVLKP